MVTWRLLLLTSAALCRDQGFGEGRSQGGKADPRLTSLTGPSSLVPGTPDPSLSKAPRLPPPWPPCAQHPPSSLVSEEAQRCLGQAGLLTEGTDRVVTPDIRWVPEGACAPASPAQLGGLCPASSLAGVRPAPDQPPASWLSNMLLKMPLSLSGLVGKECAQSMQGPRRGRAGAGEGLGSFCAPGPGASASEPEPPFRTVVTVDTV